MPDIPTWTITIDDKEANMIVRALESTMGARDKGPLRDFAVSVVSRLDSGGKTIAGDKVELLDLCDTVDVHYAVKAAGGGPIADANCDFSNRWANAVYNRLDGKADGVRKVAGKPVAKSLFGDEG